VPAAVLTDAPSGVTCAVREAAGPGDRVLNPQVLGSWLEFAVPDVLVASDSRIEIFPASVWSELEQVGLGVGDWQGRLRDWGVTVVIAGSDDVDFIGRLMSAGWRQVHADEDGVVLVRDP
jgi:hypothetical protein